MALVVNREWNTDTQFDWTVVFVQTGDSVRVPEAAPQPIVDFVEQLNEAGDLPRKLGDTRRQYAFGAANSTRVLVVSLGDKKTESLTPGDLYRAFSIAARATCDQADRNVAVLLPEMKACGLKTAATAFTMAPQGQGIYQQDSKRHPFASVHLISAIDEAEAAVEKGAITGRAINLTRELINRGAHEVSPATFADRAAQVAASTGLTCRIFDQVQLEAERMGSMLAVARGSDLEPRMVVLEYRGAGDAPFTGFVGKGVTYDSGGLSLKPSDGMKTMKSDMSGAATVLGLMQAIAEAKLPVNVRGYMGLVENMISGRAYRLGDVLTARNGVTIEVMNTDAEGRLVLADVLSFAVDEGCEKLVDLATLTGSCVVALGEDYAGLFTNEQSWAEEVIAAAKSAGELVWQLPMDDAFADQLRSDVADCKNVGTRWGGSITAAKFLQKFVGDTPWVHLDIAGPAFLTDTKPYREGGASGVMIRSLLQLVESLEAKG
ncbi:leucyl aminopeptidase [Rubinisphaera sp. JC750]|uniref:leucyl aminopeptidase n=1 Tax=Rubinisphaera sp. JC750 TaxID=2898658 RepID=UPI001F02460A|nr:leucyl aminopeptidase [Rubinisphaera sp. JC750]